MNTALNLSGRKFVPVIRQAEAAECGLASIAMIAGFHGHDVDMATMRLKFAVSMKGATLRTMIDIAASLGMSGRPVRCEPEEIRDLRLPAVLHWGLNHFVVLVAATQRRVTIHDPALGKVNLPIRALRAKFTGVALELTPNSSFTRVRQRNPLKLGSLFSLGGGVLRALLQTVVLSLVVELLVLMAPFYMQLVIDEALLKNDLGLLNVLAIVFAMLVGFRVVAVGLRALTSQFISNVLAFDMKGRIFNHMLRLPFEWFQKRQVGDIQSRFWALKAIQTFVAEGALTGILDGALGSIVLVLMFSYSPLLMATVLGSIVLYTIVRIATFNLTKRFAADAIYTDAREQTRLLETLRAMQTIKAAGSERIRETQYRNSAAASINSQIRSGNIHIGYLGCEQAIEGLTHVLVIYLGAKSVLAGDLTLGMLTAFLAYKGQFVTRYTNMVEQLFAWRLLDLQLERISDIVLTPKDERVDYGGFEGEVRGRIECRNLSYRYGFGEPLVLSQLNIAIEPGECVAIVGASGCGKSTLARLIAGLSVPTGGEILIDGRPLRDWSNRSLRSAISYVSQDDQLLAGSIAENIAFFSDTVDLERVRSCARHACIDEEIMGMPMGYESLVGDMGSSLSGGQKQRVLIARALYRSPQILILDEATAHLDIHNEMAIASSLGKLPITRIVVAHRPETIAAADRAILLDPLRLPPILSPEGTPSKIMGQSYA